MVFPTVHLNGTSKNALREQALDAVEALDKALKAMAEAAPNGRDFYPQGEVVLVQAQVEHRARMKEVEQVASEYRAMVNAIDEL